MDTNELYLIESQKRLMADTAKTFNLAHDEVPQIEAPKSKNAKRKLARYGVWQGPMEDQTLRHKRLMLARVMHKEQTRMTLHLSDVESRRQRQISWLTSMYASGKIYYAAIPWQYVKGYRQPMLRNEPEAC